jgi:hypothetical protein
MTSERLSSQGLRILREEFALRELAIVEQVAELRLMTGKQIGAVHFPTEAGSNAELAARSCRRTLERLTHSRLLIRLERRVGGIRAGSTSFIYTLGPVGQRLLAMGGPRRRFREPSATFADHTLAVTQLVVDLILASRQGRFELLATQSEPTCWRSFSTVGGRQMLRPDLFVSLGVGDYEHRYFLEIDRGTEHLPAVLRKSRIYNAYYRSGREQSKHGVFPRVLWIVPDERRLHQVARGLSDYKRLTAGLFNVATTPRAIESLAGGES